MSRGVFAAKVSNAECHIHSLMQMFIETRSPHPCNAHPHLNLRLLSSHIESHFNVFGPHPYLTTTCGNMSDRPSDYHLLFSPSSLGTKRYFCLFWLASFYPSVVLGREFTSSATFTSANWFRILIQTFVYTHIRNLQPHPLP